MTQQVGPRIDWWCLLLLTAVISRAAPALATQHDESTSPPMLAVQGVINGGDCQLLTKEYATAAYNALMKRLHAPYAAWTGEQGAVRLEFFTGREGQLIELTTVRAEGPPSLEKAARKSVLRAMPLPKPESSDVPCKRIGFSIDFFFNMDDEARTRWIKSDVESSTPGGTP